jgi:hypothetical protein
MRDNNEVWKQQIVRQKRNDTGYEDVLTPNNQCTQPDCKAPGTFHHHQWIWPNRLPGAELHRFVEALGKNTNLKISQPSELTGHTFRFYEWEKPGYTNKAGEEVKGRKYYLVAGWPDSEPEEPEHPDEPQTISAAISTAQSPNGNVTPQASSIEDLDMMFLAYADGKTDQEIKKGLIGDKEIPEIAANVNYRTNIMTNATTKRMKDSLKLIQDEGGIYHINPEAI